MVVDEVPGDERGDPLGLAARAEARYARAVCAAPPTTSGSGAGARRQAGVVPVATRASISAWRANEGAAPGPVVASAPAAAAYARASATSTPAARRALSAPQNASPAPVVSTASTEKLGTEVIPAAVTRSTPAAPRVTTRVVAPAARTAASPPRTATSCSLGTTTSHSPRSSGGQASAGAGLRIVVAPCRRPARNAAATTAGSISSWARTTPGRRERPERDPGVGAGDDDDRVLRPVVDRDQRPAGRHAGDRRQRAARRRPPRAGRRAAARRPGRRRRPPRRPPTPPPGRRRRPG